MVLNTSVDKVTNCEFIKYFAIRFQVTALFNIAVPVTGKGKLIVQLRNRASLATVHWMVITACRDRA